MLYIVSDLCFEYGRLAFMEGLKVGMLLGGFLGAALAATKTENPA